MSGSPRIAVVGSANTDLTTFADVFPRPGETIFGKSFDLGFGGKGANQAVAARYCGADVVMVAKVGNDLFGEATVKNFASMGIDATHVRIVDGVSSGVAPIFVEPNGQNRIIVVKGANDTLKPADVDAASDALRHVDAIILQFEIPLETVYYTVQFARRHHIRCIVNPAPALPAQINELIAADYFVPNETEAEVITGLPVHSLEEAKSCAASLLQKGFGKVILTLGARGSLIVDRDLEELIPPFAVTPKDTTGAGDAFIGSFSVFLAEGLPERDALLRANLYAGLSTMRVGTQKSFPKRAEFETEWSRRGGKP
ncbi:MAG TPA: ribokinase [Candidatus Acidoferrales bacterium]|jgi:ribokinase|nr:ribokinase [Candidatus Acidoferrales bacterium]